jgi:heme-degrading monooxygenase HmoA
VTSQIKPDEWIAILRDSIVPAAKQQQGFKGFVVLADPNTDKGIAYSIWATEADLKATEASRFYQEQMAKLMGVFAMPPVRELYELTVLA